MTKEQAIKLLSNETFISEIAKIEYYAGFNSEAVYKAYNEACDEAVESMEKDVEKKIHIYANGEEHCPNCDMNLTGLGFKRCIECGQLVKAGGTDEKSS